VLTEEIKALATKKFSEPERVWSCGWGAPCMCEGTKCCILTHPKKDVLKLNCQLTLQIYIWITPYLEKHEICVLQMANFYPIWSRFFMHFFPRKISLENFPYKVFGSGTFPRKKKLRKIGSWSHWFIKLTRERQSERKKDQLVHLANCDPTPQGCQIFLGAWCQNRKNVPNAYKMYQMAIKYLKSP
jgi:hypothetical protein